MSEQGRGLRVGVLGGGVLGASTAAHLARRGARVVLVTDGPLAGGASGRSLSWLNSFARRSTAYHRLRVAGLERYRSLAAAVDAAQWLRFDGGLTWAAADEVGAHRDTFAHLRSVGYPVEWLSPADVATRVPGVDPAAVPAQGAILAPDEGWVDLPRLVGHLVAEAVAHGATVRTGAGPSRVVLAGGRAAAVRTGSGWTTDVDAVVLATGAAVPAAAAEVGVHLPQASTAGLLVRTDPVRTGLRAVLNTPGVALRPAPGGGLVLDAGWSEREVEHRPDGTFAVRDSTVAGLLREGSAVLAGHPQLSVDSLGVGAKPIPADGEPVLGAVPDVPGLHVAFTHSGATLGLVAGELLADEVLTGRPDPMLRPFGPGRFA